MLQAHPSLLENDLNLLVDGNCFRKYKSIPHTCIVKGDSHRKEIAAASIVAKVHRDSHILQQCEKDPQLNMYQIGKNKGFGTKAHRDAITSHGLLVEHRKTFGMCKQFALAN